MTEPYDTIWQQYLRLVSSGIITADTTYARLLQAAYDGHCWALGAWLRDHREDIHRALRAAAHGGCDSAGIALKSSSWEE